MIIANFNKRIGLYNQTVSKSATGGTTPTWSLFATVWAMFKEDKATEGTEGGQTKSAKKGTITIRYSSGMKSTLTTDCQVQLDGHKWAITGLSEIDKDYVAISVETLQNSL